MKTKLTIILSLFILIFTTACDNRKSYSELQDEEQAVIQDYIQKNNYQVVNNEPKANEYGTNVFYKTPSGIYFHLINEGEMTDSVRNNITVGYRFIEYNLDAQNTVRLKNWEVRDFNDPVSFIYGTSNATTSLGLGLHEAIGLMKYKNSEAKVIVPAFLNTSSYSENIDKLTPVIYHLKITVIK